MLRKQLLMQDNLRPSEITGTLLFIALAVHDLGPQTESTDLESLFYVLLWISLDRLLPWRDATVKTAADAKSGVKLKNGRFDELLVCIRDKTLREACASLRGLFSKNGDYHCDATAAEFCNLLKDAQKKVSLQALSSYV